MPPVQVCCRGTPSLLGVSWVPRIRAALARGPQPDAIQKEALITAISTIKTVVVGAGVIGCAIALELRRRGAEVTVIDKNGEVGHGSTSASCGIVRRFYAQPGMMAMAHEAAQIWADWSTYLGPIDDDLARFERPGMLFIPPQMDDSARAIFAEMQRLGIDAKILSAGDIAERFPFLDTTSFFPPRPLTDPDFLPSVEATEGAGDPPVEGAVFEEDAGYIVSPGLATHNLRRAGEREGVRFQLSSEVLEIHRENDAFRLVIRSASPIAADVVVNVAGPHSSVINRMAGVTLPLRTRALRREVHAMKNPVAERPDAGQTGHGPLPVVGDLNGGVYFRPESGGADIIVGSTDPACDPLDWVDDPDEYHDRISDEYRERQCLRVMKRFPEVRLGPPRGVAALYDVTEQDWYPIADRTDLPGYYVCIGTSGSSFKTAPVLGQMMAQLIFQNEAGQNTDETPFQLPLPHLGLTVDTTFLSRLRGTIKSSGTVMG